MSLRVVTSFCRICSGCCGVRMTVDEDDKIVEIRGDKEQFLTKGYACFKGLQAEEAHHGRARLMRPLKRQPDGSFVAIPLAQALDEIAEKMKGIHDFDGVDALALFVGNGGYLNSSAMTMQMSFMEALGSPQFFSTVTIDQSSKVVSFERMGGWGAGVPGLDECEVALVFGSNPLVSHATPGLLIVDPTRRLKAAKARGFKLIVVDPRRTETARHADLFVQPIPGQDAAIISALLRIILDEGWNDQEFCARYVGADRMEALRREVDPFKPEMVAARAGIEAGLLRDVAEMFARDHKRGAAFSATGPNMAPFSNVTQHLLDCLNVVCGRFRRAGDKIIIDLLSTDQPIRDGVIPAGRSWQTAPPSRIRGVGRLFGQKLSGTLAEEILTPGKGQIKSLIIDGANIANSMPDERRICEALSALELLVCIEPYMTATARLAHYIIPPKMQYERADLPFSIDGYSLIPEHWAQFTPAVLRPPADSELADDWYFFWAISKRLGLRLNFRGEPLDMETPPTTEDLLTIRLHGTHTSLEELKQYPSGKVFDVPSAVVQPGPEDGARFDVMPADVAEELRQFLAHATVAGGTGTPHRRAFLLSCRRMRDMQCSNGTHLDNTLARTPSNPIHIHPADMERLSLIPGDSVEITSDSGKIMTQVQQDETMKPGVISLSHGWGGGSDDEENNRPNVNRLIDCTREREEVNAMPWMSAIPVDVVLLHRASVAVAPLIPTGENRSPSYVT